MVTYLLFLGRNMGVEKMKSIGNGWKRAQEAKKRAWLNQSKTSYDLQKEAYMRYRALRAMSPEAMKEKAEREAPMVGEFVEITPSQLAEVIGKTKPKTLWQRIKRAMRSL